MKRKTRDVTPGFYAFGQPVVGKKICASCSKLWLNVFELSVQPLGQLLLLVNTKLDLVLELERKR